jgi:hypothetical protein
LGRIEFRLQAAYREARAKVSFLKDRDGEFERIVD